MIDVIMAGSGLNTASRDSSAAVLRAASTSACTG